MKEQTVNTTAFDPGVPAVPFHPIDDDPVTPPGTKPVTKLQHLLAKLAGRSAGAKPKTKLQMLLYNMAGGDLDVKPATKDEQLIMDVIDAGITVPGGTKTITKNGTYNVAKFANAKVNVPNPSSGSITITENGTYNVTEKASAEVNVPNPSSGSITITENGTYDVTEKASVEVEIPQYPLGTLTIVNNSGLNLNILDGCLYEAEINGQTYFTATTATPLLGGKSTDIKVPLTIIKAKDGTILSSNLSNQYFRMEGFGLEGTFTATLNEGGLKATRIYNAENTNLRYLAIDEGISTGVHNTATITISRTS